MIGGLRMVLLWLGDILLAYGIAGPALPALRRLRPRTGSSVPPPTGRGARVPARPAVPVTS
ncbi:hypothetical protein Plo01_03740 [Planobispora longispora]|uniref:Uncharacterized protein n=1 Tax=Planobispora longispora TaxID=28887 RepID=A0A8J3RFU7_9ACTN|nr:hypothetical protein Plo01_03740 [Planobispora longispora]